MEVGDRLTEAGRVPVGREAGPSEGGDPGGGSWLRGWLHPSEGSWGGGSLSSGGESVSCRRRPAPVGGVEAACEAAVGGWVAVVAVAVAVVVVPCPAVFGVADPKLLL